MQGYFGKIVCKDKACMCLASLFIAERQKSRRDYTWVETLRFSTSLTSAPWGAQKMELLVELPTFNPYGISPFGVKT